MGPAVLLSQTSVSGNQSGTWLQAYEPYYIDGDVTVPSGQTLTIEPGCRVIFNGNYDFNIYGRLMAVGTPSERISFTNGSTSYTGSRIFQDAAAADTSVFAFCDIEDFRGYYCLYSDRSSLRMSDCCVLNDSTTAYSPVQVYNGHAVIERCVFTDNSNTSTTGAALQVGGSGSIVDCSFFTNEGVGHALRVTGDYEVTGCLFDGNQGGISFYSGTSTVLDCDFTNDNGSGSGGGIYINSGATSVQIQGCTFANCQASRGGAIAVFGYAEVVDCEITGNSAADDGGGLYISDPCRIEKCLITGNTCQDDGGGIYAYDEFDIVQCTVAGNTATGVGGGICFNDPAASMNSCIVWGNAASSSQGVHGTFNCSYSDVYGILPPGTGNISSDPFFADSSSGDYSLLEVSPCIDTGDPGLPVDPDGTRADMGAIPFFHALDGDIEIAITPDGLLGPWHLSGPGGFEYDGDGNDSLSSMEPGYYEITWLNLAGWSLLVPSTDLQELVAGDTLRFSGIWENLPPVISLIQDVPDDQGGWLRIWFNRCGFDISGAGWPDTAVVGYNVYRRVDDAATRACVLQTREAKESDSVERCGWTMDELARLPRDTGTEALFWKDRVFLLTDVLSESQPPGLWEVILHIYAQQQDEYICLASSVADLIDGELPVYSVYYVSAHTTLPTVYYASTPDSGYSIDNIAPGVPSSISATYSETGVALDWDDAPEADFQYYRIYRGLDEGFIPSPANLLHETASSTWTHHTSSPWGYYYKITTLDHAGNESEPGLPEGVAGFQGAFSSSGTLLSDALPNPFDACTVLAFAVPTPGRVRLKVYDAAGRLVVTLVDEHRSAGRHEAVWDGKGADGRMSSPGIYLYRLETGTYSETKTMVLLK
jgi:hypothetical protein